MIVVPALTFVSLLVLWELTTVIFKINRIILPSPSEIAVAFANNYPLLLKETGITMAESVLGFLLGSLSAYLLAVTFVHSRTVQQAVYPYAVALKSTPLIAIAPLLVLWFGNGMLSKIVMSALVAFFPVLVNSVSGLTSIDPEAFDLMKSLSASKWQVLTKIRIPSSLPYLFSSLKVASSLAVVGAVIGEFTGSIEGIGHLINTSSYYLETPLMFAAIVMISLGGVLFFALMAHLERKIVFWEEPR
ncbi:MAG TPA: ABC transporter permease [Pyrinomonadaceae bacterium]|jgi:NitT/TauT family transport system permease protein|nr:ABC transporter permease [Pyrinomonadaceae bacterium]